MKYESNGNTLIIRYGNSDREWKEFVDEWNFVIKTTWGLNMLRNRLSDRGVYIVDECPHIPSISDSNFSQAAHSYIPRKLPANRVKRGIYRMMGRDILQSREFDTVSVSFESDPKREFPGHCYTFTENTKRRQGMVDELRRDLYSEKWTDDALKGPEWPSSPNSGIEKS